MILFYKLQSTKISLQLPYNQLDMKLFLSEYKELLNADALSVGTNTSQHV